MSVRPFSRRELRTTRLSWLRANQTRIAIFIGLVLGLLALETFLLSRVPSGPFRWYVMGFVHAAILAVSVGGLSWAFVAQSPTALRHIRGAWGEENTRDLLSRAKRRRLIWGWVDSVSLENCDIDHLIITRRGGLVAIDSKWRSSLNRSDIEVMVNSARKVRLRSEGVLRTVTRTERGNHRTPGPSLSATPLVVLWGAAQQSMPVDASSGGIAFVRGRDLLRWLGARDGEPVDRRAARDLLDKLEMFRSEAWPRETVRARDRRGQ